MCVCVCRGHLQVDSHREKWAQSRKNRWAVVCVSVSVCVFTCVFRLSSTLIAAPVLLHNKHMHFAIYVCVCKCVCLCVRAGVQLPQSSYAPLGLPFAFFG